MQLDFKPNDFDIFIRVRQGMKDYALVFDHDGTLVNSETLHYACWRQALSEYDVEVSVDEYVLHHNGIPTNQNALVFIETYGLSIDVESLANKKRALFAEKFLITPPPMLPTVESTLTSALDDGRKMAIATGASKEDLQRSVRLNNLDRYVTTFATTSDVDRGKPAPDVYLLACEKLGVEPQKAIAFEDTAAGIAAAKSAGLICFAIPNSYSKSQDLGQADQIFSTLFRAYLAIDGLEG